MKVLSIEASTSSAKAMVYDSEKGIIREQGQPYGADIDRGGIMDVNAVFGLVCSLARKVTEGIKDIGAVGICETWHNMCAFDSKLNPLSLLYSWNYTGYGDIWDKVRRSPSLTDEFYTRTGCMPHTTYSRTAVAYMKANGTDTEKMLFSTFGGYCFYMLTGSFFQSRCSLSGSGFLNLYTADYDDFVLDYIGVKKEQFGQLVSNEEIRPLTAAGAGLLGVKAGIPVVPAHADGAMNIVAVCGNRPGVVTMSVGTSGAMRMINGNPVVPSNHSLWCYRGVNSFVSGAATNGACNCINWFRERYARGISFEELEKDFEPREDFPCFLPFVFGERCPGWNDARRDGFTENIEKYSVRKCFQAVEMGVLFNLYQAFDNLTAENGQVNEIILSGGISNSVHWIKMACDIFGRDMLVSECSDASTIGAAVLALYAAEEIDDINGFTAEYGKLRKYRYCGENHEHYMKHYGKYLEYYHQGKEVS